MHLQSDLQVRERITGVIKKYNKKELKKQLIQIIQADLCDVIELLSERKPKNLAESLALVRPIPQLFVRYLTHYVGTQMEISEDEIKKVVKPGDLLIYKELLRPYAKNISMWDGNGQVISRWYENSPIIKHHYEAVPKEFGRRISIVRLDFEYLEF